MRVDDSRERTRMPRESLRQEEVFREPVHVRDAVLAATGRQFGPARQLI